MIEVNLLPGGERRRTRKRLVLPFAAPKLGGNLNGLAAFAVLGWIVGPAVVLWLFLAARSQVTELGFQTDLAVQDSARYSALIGSQNRLQARRDTIASKMQLIQDLDAGRYVWPHILNEISRVLPEYTWLTSIAPFDAEAPVASFEIKGRTGTTFALTRFMKDLEESDFIRSVDLMTTEQVREQDDQIVHEFILRAVYEEPPVERIVMVPITRMEH